MAVTLPPGSPAQETAPGNFLLTADDHISVGVSSSNAFALVLALLSAPLPVCGDGVAQGGEACDEAAANGSATGCCNADCTLRSLGAICRPASEACDPAELCDGALGACPADVVSQDGDGDAICDAQDPCTNVAHGRDFVTPPKSKLLLAKVNADPTAGNDKLVLGGSFALPGSTRFGDLDPRTRGARVVITSAQGDPILDVGLPPGSYTGGDTRGWTTNGASTIWQYRDKTAAPLAGISSLKISDASHNAFGGQLRVLLKGKDGTYPVTTGDDPLHATVVLGDQFDAAAGRCGESAFAAANCAFNSAQTKLLCRR